MGVFPFVNDAARFFCKSLQFICKSFARCPHFCEFAYVTSIATVTVNNVDGTDKKLPFSLSPIIAIIAVKQE